MGKASPDLARAAAGFARLRQVRIAEDDPRATRNGGAIALGQPLGILGARITGTAALELQERRGASGRFPPCASAWGRASR